MHRDRQPGLCAAAAAAAAALALHIDQYGELSAGGQGASKARTHQQVVRPAPLWPSVVTAGGRTIASRRMRTTL